MEKDAEFTDLQSDQLMSLDQSSFIVRSLVARCTGQRHHLSKNHSDIVVQAETSCSFIFYVFRKPYSYFKAGQVQAHSSFSLVSANSNASSIVICSVQGRRTRVSYASAKSTQFLFQQFADLGVEVAVSYHCWISRRHKELHAVILLKVVFLWEEGQ